MKNIIRTITIAVLVMYVTFCILYFILYPSQPQYRDCGFIISKSSEEQPIKHGTRTELYLNIQFEQAGFKSLNVSRETYYQSQKGEKVCFDLDRDMPLRHYIISSSGLMCIVLIFIGALVLFVVYLVED